MSEDVPPFLPKPGILLLGIPILGIALTFLAYAVLFGMGWVGRAVTGPPVELVISGCPAGVEVVQQRLEDMGLPQEAAVVDEAGVTRIGTSLPFADSDPEGFAATLATPGTFAMKDGDEVLATHEDIVYAGVRLDEMMTPSTLVMLDDDGRDRVYARMDGSPDAKTHIYIDDVEVWSFGNRRPTMNGEFEIPPSADGDQARMQLAAARGIVLNHGPLPCALTIRALPRE